MRYWVYIHTCKDNGKKYVGITTKTKPEYRWGRNGEGYCQNKHFYSAILKHGWSNFQHEVFEVDSKEEMYRKEVELISFYHSNDPEYGYNNSSGGEKSGLGCTRSEEYRKKMSEDSLKRWADPEYRKKQSEAQKEVQKKVHSDPEYRKHMSEAQKKVHSDPGYRKKISETLKKVHSDPEYRKRISETLKGKPHSEEHREHLAEANRRTANDPERIRKIVEAAKKRGLDPEFRKHMSEVHKGKPQPKVKISLPDGTIVEVSKQNLTRHYINKGKKFEYVD